VLAELARVFPRLELKFLRGDVKEILELLKKGDAALAIAGPLAESWDRLDVWPLFSEPFRAVLPQAHGLARRPMIACAELSEIAYVARPFCEYFHEMGASLGRLNLVPKSRCDAANDSDAIELVAAGLGVALAPQSMALVAGLQSCVVEGLDLVRQVKLYVVSGRERSAATSAMMNLLRARDWSPRPV